METGDVNETQSNKPAPGRLNIDNEPPGTPRKPIVIDIDDAELTGGLLEEKSNRDEEIFGETYSSYDKHPSSPKKPIVIDIDEAEFTGGLLDNKSVRGEEIDGEKFSSQFNSSFIRSSQNKLSQSGKKTKEAERNLGEKFPRSSKKIDPMTVRSKTEASGKISGKQKRDKKVKIRNISSFFQKANSESSTVKIERKLRTAKCENQETDFETAAYNNKELNETSQIENDDFGIVSSGDTWCNDIVNSQSHVDENEVIEKDVVVSPPSPSELDLFDDDYSQTLQF